MPFMAQVMRSPTPLKRNISSPNPMGIMAR